MVCTRKKRQSNRKLLKQLDDFDQDIIIGNTASDIQENTVVNEGPKDGYFTVDTSINNLAINEFTVNVKTLEKCLIEIIDREMSNFVDTVENRIQNAILNAIESIVAPKIELAIRSINAASGLDATSFTANSKHVGISDCFENASGNNNVLHESIVNDENRTNFPGDSSELSVPETRFGRRTHTHHLVTGQTAQTNHISEFLNGRILSPTITPTSELVNTRSQDNNLPKG